MVEVQAAGLARQSDTRLSVLHVTECFEAGTAGAIEAYTASLPDFDHKILYGIRDGRSGSPSNRFTRSLVLPHGVRAFGAIRAAGKQADIVHAHSTMAGVLCRLALRGVVYTPHCYAFERTDLGRAARAAIFLVEALLARRTSVVAACSRREATLARRLRRTTQAVVIPNIATLPKAERKVATDLVVLTVGRACAQKGVDEFVEVATQCMHLGIRAKWIGSGDPAEVDKLRSAGVEVTGWLSAQAVADELSGAAAYLHTAAWEGFPLTIVEGVAAGVPIVALRRDYLIGCPREYQALGTRDAVNLLLSVCEQDQASACVAAWREALRDHTGEVQSRRLRAAYAIAARARGPRMSRTARVWQRIGGLRTGVR